MEDILQEIRGTNLRDIRLDVFEGPFDLLLTLLERNKLDAADIPISLIADQYMEVLSANFDMEIASEFLVMASTLLHLKSRRLLPKEEKAEEEISEEELLRRLQEYRRYKEIAPAIGALYETWHGALYKMPEPLHFPRRYEPVQIDRTELEALYREIETRNRERRSDTAPQMARILKVEKVSIRDTMRRIVKRLVGSIRVTFRDLFGTPSSSRMERVTGFLAMLELDRRKRIHATQDRLFGEITIARGAEFAAGADDQGNDGGEP